MRHTTLSEKDTQKLGIKYGKKCKGGEVFLLSGELGTGKTQFTKGLALGLGITADITSPTFTYEKIYTSSKLARGNGKKGLTLYHFDLYREIILDEDIKLLMQEAFNDEAGVTAVEWSGRMGKFLPQKYFKVQFAWSAENERKIQIEIK